MSQDVKKALTSVDRSTKSLVNAADVLIKTVADQTAQVAALTAQQVSLATDIEFKQSELQTLEDQTTVKQREQAAELRLRVREDEDNVLADLLKQRGLVTQTPEQVQENADALAKALASNQQAINEAVKQTTEQVSASFKAQLTQKESEHKVQIATLQANEKSAQERISFLTAQTNKLEAQIEADREARVEIAKAEASRQAVTVNTTK